MRANYGYKDGSGEYFIAIETDACIECADTPCVQACPARVLEIITDHKPATENVPRSMENEGHKVLEVAKLNDTDWRIVVRKS
jgi:NAD-dependent dihydropyrimidine dehydrogenase PreA subunit